MISSSLLDVPWVTESRRWPYRRQQQQPPVRPSAAIGRMEAGLPSLAGFIACIPVQLWELPDLPPEGVNIVAHDYTGPRPYVEDAQGRRWLLDGSGDVA